jgi:aerotaxis receptor
VKNRRKNGDHYWVMANVTPLLDGVRPVGYMSVRTEVTRAQVADAERLYASMRAEQQAGHQRQVLEQGQLRRRDLLGRMLGWRLGLHHQVLAVLLLAAAAGGAAGQMADSPTHWFAAIGLLLALGLGLTSWVLRLTMRPIDGLLAFANRLAAGDLTGRLDTAALGSHARFARSLNQLAVNLRAIVHDARSGVDHLRSTANELASGNQELSGRTESQAASLEQTASSMEEITGTVRQSAEAARGAAQFAREATDITRRSASSVHQVTATMQAISDSSQRIRDIIQVIEGIAFQTNILALNAAVEAARAGEQGRGFAVVAAEVRSLAQRTSTAAREVKQLIEDSAGKVAAGASQTDAARCTMDEALEAVQRMGMLVGDIDVGAKEQFAGITQVNQAVAHMDMLTQQNAALVEQLAAAAGSVQTQAETVAEAVQVFRLESGGAAAPAAVQLHRQMKAQLAGAAG